MAKHVFTKEEVHELVEKENVHFLRVMFSDLFGTTKSVDLPVSQLDKLMNNKMRGMRRMISLIWESSIKIIR